MKNLVRAFYLSFKKINFLKWSFQKIFCLSQWRDFFSKEFLDIIIDEKSVFMAVLLSCLEVFILNHISSPFWFKKSNCRINFFLGWLLQHQDLLRQDSCVILLDISFTAIDIGSVFNNSAYLLGVWIVVDIFVDSNFLLFLNIIVESCELSVRSIGLFGINNGIVQSLSQILILWHNNFNFSSQHFVISNQRFDFCIQTNVFLSKSFILNFKVWNICLVFSHSSDQSIISVQ